MTATRERAYRALAALFQRAGLDNPELDARLLVQAASGCDDIGMIREPQKELSAAEIETLRQFEARRLTREPVSRILGAREFWGLTFEVSPATLDPRADSETLVETALGLVGDVEAPSILDIGTGTGCLLIALLHERRDATGIGADISEAALVIASRNAERLGCGSRAAFRRASWGDGLGARFDLVISNPPYIEAGIIPTLDEEVRGFDPILALDGGADGLDAYRALRHRLPTLLKPDGHAVVELGAGQVEPVTEIFLQAGLVVLRVVPDLGSVPRAIVAALPRP